jgi:hypothetical protein
MTTLWGTRTTLPLYVRKALPVAVDGVGTGKTVIAKLCEERSGDPPAIGTLSITLTETGTTGNYTGLFARAALLSQITTAGLTGRVIYLHLDDGVAWHDVWAFRAVDVDPDLEFKP